LSLLHSTLVGSEGTDLLILHGFLGMGDNWKTHAKGFSERGFRVHLLDQRNHGRSFWNETFNYEVMAEDVIRYCEAKNLNKVLVLGHSMGGKTAMHLACSYPSKVKALLIADIAPKKYEPHHQQILNGLSQLNFDQLHTRAAADEELSKTVSDPATRQFLLKNLYWVEPGKLGLRLNTEVLKNVSEAIGAGLDPKAQSGLPCLFIKGERSAYILDTDLPVIKHHFPAAKLELIPKVGHWLHAENPKRFFEISSQWLEQYR